MKRHEIQLRIAQMALEVAGGKDILTVAERYNRSEFAVRDACKKYGIEQRRPAIVGRKTVMVRDVPPKFEDLVRIMEQFCENNITDLGRHDLQQLAKLCQRLSSQLIARGQA